MINSSKTFPSAVLKARLPHKNIPNQLEGSKPSLNTGNPFAAFRKQYRDMENKRVMDSVAQNKANALNWNTQATKQGIVNIPGGSFNRGANLNSGNNAFGSHRGGYRGGIRSQEGSAYIRGLLQKRAQQFDAIRALKEGAPAIVESAQPQPLDKDEASQVAIDLLIQTIQTSFLEGNYEEIKTEDIRKLFGSLRTFGFQIPKDTLLTYFESFGRMIDDIRRLRGEKGDKRLDIDELKKVNDVLLNKVYYLLEALVAGYDLSPKQQKLYLSTAVKRINKITPKTLAEETLGQPLPKSKLISRAKPSSKQPKISEFLKKLASEASESKSAEELLKETEDAVKSQATPEPSPIKPDSLPDLPSSRSPKKKETKKKPKIKRTPPAPAAAPESKSEPVSEVDEVRTLLGDLDVIGEDTVSSGGITEDDLESIASNVRDLRSRTSKVNSTLIRNAFVEAMGRLTDKKLIKKLKSIAGIRGRV